MFFTWGCWYTLVPGSRTHRLHTPLNQANRAFNTRDTPPNKPRLVSFSISYDTRHFNAYFLRILILSIVPLSEALGGSFIYIGKNIFHEPIFTSLQKRSVNRSHFRTHCLKVVYLICPPLRLSTHFRTDPMRLLVPHIFPIRSSICYYGYKYFFEPQW